MSTDDLNRKVIPRKTTAREFWSLANQPGGADRALRFYHEEPERDPGTSIFPEYPVNLLAYAKLQAGQVADAVELFKLNVEAFPASANAQDSLSDGYLAAGKKDLALAAEEKCVQLLPNDPNDAEFKAELGRAARAKIEKIESEQE